MTKRPPLTTIGAGLAAVALLGTITAGATPAGASSTDATSPGATSTGADSTRTPPAGAATSADGVWRTDGYSTLLAIEGGRARLFDTTAISCVEGFGAPQRGRPSADGTVRFAEGEIDFTVRPVRGRSRAVFHFAGSAGDRSMRRIRALPAACTRPAPTGPLATFDVFWTTYAENYPFFAARGIDWSAVRAKYRPQVRPDMTDTELFDLLVAMIRPLGDLHTGIRAGEDRRFMGHRPGTTPPSRELNDKVQAFVERRDLGRPLQAFGNGLIGYADLPGRIGYLRLVTFTGYTDEPTFDADAAELDRALDAILTRRRTSGPEALRGLIVDLRVNGGGHDALGLQLASRLTARNQFAYAKRARNDAADPTRFTRPQPVRVEPESPAYTGPITILTGGSTVSAGETFIQATMERSPRPVRIGENTQGVFSDVLIRTLPNGWMFVLPNEEFLTRSGRTFDGVGIAPDIRTPVFTDEEFAHDRDSAFDRALTVLR